MQGARRRYERCKVQGLASFYVQSLALIQFSRTVQSILLYMFCGSGSGCGSCSCASRFISESITIVISLLSTLVAPLLSTLRRMTVSAWIAQTLVQPSLTSVVQSPLSSCRGYL